MLRLSGKLTELTQLLITIHKLYLSLYLLYTIIKRESNRNTIETREIKKRKKFIYT